MLDDVSSPLHRLDRPSLEGFLNGPTDTTTALTHLGAREYDPTLARFLSVDPLLDPYDPLHLNAYSYAKNNPLKYADPTGTRPLDEDGSTYHPITKKTLSPARTRSSTSPQTKTALEQFVNRAKELARKAFTDVSNVVGPVGATAWVFGHSIRPTAVGGGFEWSRHVKDKWRGAKMLGATPNQIGSANQILKHAGRGVVILGGAIEGVDVWNAHPDAPSGERAGRAMVSGSLAAAGSAAGGYFGAQLGVSVGAGCGFLAWVCAPLLAAAGGVAGGAVGGNVGSSVGDWVGDKVWGE